MAAPERREVVVVGAGLLGLATAAELTARGRDVVCLERSTVGNERSGSKGAARIFRLGYEDPVYVAMGRLALERWRQLEAAVGEELVEAVGFVTFGDDVAAVRSAMESAGAPPEVLPPGEAQERFPGFVIETETLVEPEAGVIRADRALAAFGAGVADLRQLVEVRKVSEGPDTVTIETTTGVFEAPCVVLCAGAWSSAMAVSAGLVGGAGLWPSWQQVAYFAERGGTPAMPAFVRRSAVTTYGLPHPRQPGAVGTYKIGLHDPGPAMDPAASGQGSDSVAESDPDEVRLLAEAAAAYVPGLDPGPIDHERCTYDNTPDTDFVLDRHGRIVVGAGTSGHGFKFGPLLGEVLADLVEEKAPRVDLGRFSLSRAALRR